MVFEEVVIKIVIIIDFKVVVIIILILFVMREGEEVENGRCFYVYLCNYRVFDKFFLRWNIVNLCYLIVKIVFIII